MLKSSALLILFVISVANCQFFYNYEENRQDPTETQNYDPSAYQYNPPSAVNQQYVQPRGNEAEPQNEAGQRRTRIRVRSRNYNSDPDYNEPQQQPENAPRAEPEYDQRAARQERRQARRRQRQLYYVQPPTQPPRVYSPSIFENVGLGEAPSGVYIPENSFLNVLRGHSQRAPASQPAVAAPQTTNYVQPSVNYVNNNPQPRFFVQPPSNDEPRQPNLILPVTRPQAQHVVSTPSRQGRENYNSVPQNIPARTVRTNRRSQRVRPTPEYPQQPTVDIDSYRQYTDDVNRDDIQVMPKVEYVAPVTRSQNRRRKVTTYQVTAAPRVYSPSIFENVGLGEAPSGIYVPEDSLLNVLRNPSAGHTENRVARRETHQLQAQPTYNDYIPEVIEEEQYQPPPPPPPPRRRTSQRNRQPQSSRRTERRGYQNEYGDQTAAQPEQPSSQRRSQRINEDYEDFARQRPPAQPQPQPARRTERRGYQNEYDDQIAVQPEQPSSQRRSQILNEDYEDFARQRPPAQPHSQSHRRPAPAQPQAQPQRRPAPAPRQKPESSTSEREQSSFKKAKLAIAALPLDTDDDGIPGEAGVNYPTLHVIPRTTFSCSQQSHNGYYADLETSCQVVHLCQAGGVQNSFLCPNGTIFSQEKFSCQWWYKVNCSDAPNFYIKNDELYKVPEKKERKRN